MKILHILDHSIPLQSGYTFRSRAIIREQRARGWDTVHLTTPKHGPSAASEEVVDGLSFFRTAPASVQLPLLAQLSVVSRTRRRLLEVIDRTRPDILHAHSPALNGAAAIQAARVTGLPVVYEVRAFWEDAAVDHGTSTAWGPRYHMTRGLETWVMRRADAVTTICDGLRQDILARGLPAEKVTVIPNAVDIETFSGADVPDTALRGQLGLEGRTVLGFVGSFYGYEGLHLLIDALPAMLQERPDLALLLVGGGPAENDLRARAQRLGVAEKVVFAGRIPHAQVQRYYELIDVLAYPRLQMRLTELVTPLKPLEAMAQYKLFVASDVGGHRELIQDGVNGVLFRSGDPDALARSVLWLLGARDVWPHLRANGRRYVEGERNWHTSVARYAPIYERLQRRLSLHATAVAPGDTSETRTPAASSRGTWRT